MAPVVLVALQSGDFLLADLELLAGLYLRQCVVSVARFVRLPAQWLKQGAVEVVLFVLADHRQGDFLLAEHVLVAGLLKGVSRTTRCAPS